MRVSIIIPVWGDPSYTDACLEHLTKNTTDYSLILVDNTGVYSVPECVGDNLAAIFRPKENLGWSGGNNCGAKAAKTSDCLVFVNCDCEPEVNWLTELLTAFDDPEVAVAGARLHYPDGRIQHSGISITRHPGGVAAHNRQDEHGTEDVDGVTGACLAVRRSVFDELGGFDEGYWNGADDVDFCLSVQSLGRKIRYVSTSNLLHHESVTDNVERWRRVHENVARLNSKWGL